MKYYNTVEIKTEIGVFLKYYNGYFKFQFQPDEYVVFEEVSTEALEIYDLRDVKYINSKFNVTYKEIITDLDDEDFLIFRLLKLEQL